MSLCCRGNILKPDIAWDCLGNRNAGTAERAMEIRLRRESCGNDDKQVVVDVFVEGSKVEKTVGFLNLM